MAKTPEEAQEFCNEIIEKCDTVIENTPKGEEYAQSVREKVTSIQDTINKNGTVSEKQLTALENMDGGISRWIRD